MPETSSLLAFALISLGMVLTPGPIMVYLISRSICRDARGPDFARRRGAWLSVYMTCAALGITAIVMAVPYAYDALRFAGALYLLYLAWQAVNPADARPSSAGSAERQSAQAFHDGSSDQSAQSENRRDVSLAAAQFVSTEHGSVLTQSLILGTVQIVISLSVNAIIAIAAGSIALFLANRPTWLVVQRWLMGTVLAGLAVRMATECAPLTGSNRITCRAHRDDSDQHGYRNDNGIMVAASRRVPRHQLRQDGLRLIAILGSAGTGRLVTACQVISSIRPSKCSATAVQLSTQSPVLM